MTGTGRERARARRNGDEDKPRKRRAQRKDPGEVVGVLMARARQPLRHNLSDPEFANLERKEGRHKRPAQCAKALDAELARHDGGSQEVAPSADIIGNRQAGQAAAAEAHGRHAEVAPVLLHHHVGRNLGGAKHAVQACVDPAVFADSVHILWPRVVVPCLELHERQLVGRVTVHLVGAHVDERRLGTMLTRGLEQVKRAGRVDIEVVERTCGSEVV